MNVWDDQRGDSIDRTGGADPGEFESLYEAEVMVDRYLLNPFFLDEALPGLEWLVGPGWRINRSGLPQSTTEHRNQPLAELGGDTVTRGERPAAIVGDCCASIAVVAGLERAGLRPALIWLDAHGDFNTPETSPSGKWKSGKAAQVTSRLAADFTAWETDNAKFKEQFERVVKALRTDESAQEAPPESRL